jgi:aerobic-type carbon monoxide dehydrogenase small subunit (CoxS/CutS family)
MLEHPDPVPSEPIPSIDITLHVNGESQRLSVLPGQTLLDALRNGLRLHSVREGCGIGVCGACTVLSDGQPVSSCLQLAWMAQDNAITTVEGLPRDGQLHPVQEAFVEKTAFQCSYCTPGFELATVALLAGNSTPTPEQVKEYLAGNLCRCGSYVKILAAVLAAGEAIAAGGGAAGQEDSG